jgi:hypothetical protein
MHVLMMGQLAGKKEDYIQLQPDENKFIRTAIAEGLVRDIFVKNDQTGIVLILPDVTATKPERKWRASHSSSTAPPRSNSSKSTIRQQVYSTDRADHSLAR